MRQVLWNLVRNAIQASSARSTVTVRVDVTDTDVTLSVDDQGPGVSAEESAHIFDDFFTTRTHGAGIGLAVVRRIVEDHASMGARLQLARAEGGGASFRVILSREVSGLHRSTPPPPRLSRPSQA